MIVFILAATLCAGVCRAQATGSGTEDLYQTAREQYENEVRFYLAARAEYLRLLEVYRANRTAENLETLGPAARDFLSRAAAALVKRLEVIKNFIYSRTTISENEKIKIISEINRDIEWLNSRQLKIETASFSALKNNALEVRKYWFEHQARVKHIVGLILSARIDYFLEQGETIAYSLSNEIELLKQNGYDTSRLEAWLADYLEKLDLVKNKNLIAREKYNKIPATDAQSAAGLIQVNELFVAGNQFIRQAHDYLLTARKALEDIMEEMKTAGG